MAEVKNFKLPPARPAKSALALGSKDPAAIVTELRHVENPQLRIASLPRK